MIITASDPTCVHANPQGGGIDEAKRRRDYAGDPDMRASAQLEEMLQQRHAPRNILERRPDDAHERVTHAAY